jgi:hypothetical protein
MRPALILLVLVVLAGGYVAVDALGQNEGTRLVLVQLDTDNGTRVVPMEPLKRRPSPGARVLGRLPLTDPEGHPRGHAVTVCTIVDQRTVSCTYSMRLREGTIEALGSLPTEDGGGGTIPAVGGTGRYGGASGVVKFEESQGDRMTVTVELQR